MRLYQDALDLGSALTTTVSTQKLAHLLSWVTKTSQLKTSPWENAKDIVTMTAPARYVNFENIL
jgi:hypothetical protein